MSTEEIQRLRLQVAQLAEKYVDLEDAVLDYEDRANDALDLASTALHRMEALLSFVLTNSTTFEERDVALALLKEDWERHEA